MIRSTALHLTWVMLAISVGWSDAALGQGPTGGSDLLTFTCGCCGKKFHAGEGYPEHTRKCCGAALDPCQQAKNALKAQLQSVASTLDSRIRASNPLGVGASGIIGHTTDTRRYNDTMAMLKEVDGLGCDSKALGDWAKQHGLEVPPAPMTPEQSKFEAYQRAGMSREQAANSVALEESIKINAAMTLPERAQRLKDASEAMKAIDPKVAQEFASEQSRTQQTIDAMARAGIDPKASPDKILADIAKIRGAPISPSPNANGLGDPDSRGRQQNQAGDFHDWLHDEVIPALKKQGVPVGDEPPSRTQDPKNVNQPDMTPTVPPPLDPELQRKVDAVLRDSMVHHIRDQAASPSDGTTSSPASGAFDRLRHSGLPNGAGSALPDSGAGNGKPSADRTVAASENVAAQQRAIVDYEVIQREMQWRATRQPDGSVSPPLGKLYADPALEKRYGDVILANGINTDSQDAAASAELLAKQLHVPVVSIVNDTEGVASDIEKWTIDRILPSGVSIEGSTYSMAVEIIRRRNEGRPANIMAHSQSGELAQKATQMVAGALDQGVSEGKFSQDFRDKYLAGIRIVGVGAAVGDTGWPAGLPPPVRKDNPYDPVSHSVGRDPINWPPDWDLRDHYLRGGYINQIHLEDFGRP